MIAPIVPPPAHTPVKAGRETLAVYGKAMEVNHLLNLPMIAKSSGVASWRAEFGDVPAVVVGAGPSLDSDIELLRDLDSRALVIATDRALKPMLDLGIAPHVVVSADMCVDLVDLYRGLTLPDDLVLLYDRDAYHPVVEAWPGHLLTYDTYFDTGIWSRTFLPRKGYLSKNLCVAHTAFYFAHLAGCTPIILTGVDNAFPSEYTHAKGASQVDGGKVDPAHPSWITIPGVLGPVRSSRGFAAFARAFEVARAACGAHLVSTTPNGAVIEGAEWRTLSSALGEYAVADRGVSERVREIMAQPIPMASLEAYDRQCEKVVKQLDDVVRIAGNGMMQLREAARVDHTRDPRKFCAKIIKADLCRMDLLKGRFVQCLLGKMMYKTVFLIETRFQPEINSLKPGDPKRLWKEAACLELLFVKEIECASAYKECLERARVGLAS